MDVQFIEELLRFPDMQVVAVRLEHGANAVHVDLAWKEEHCLCPGCKGTASKRKAEARKEPVRHLDCVGYKTLLHFDSMEMRCGQCGKTFNRTASFMGESVFLTGQFVQEMVETARGTSVSQVAEWNDQPVSSFTRRYFAELQEADEERVIPPVRRLGIDETAFLGGRGNYVLLLHDLDRHEVIDVLRDRRKETLKTYLEGHREEVFAGLEAVCIDMWKPYKQAVDALFPKVEIVVDRFHVMQHMSEALDGCRRAVAKKTKDPETKDLLKKEYRFALLRSREEQLSMPGGRKQLREVLGLNLELRRLYELKERFRRIYHIRKPKKAQRALENWIRCARYAASQYLKDFIQMVRHWKTEILNFAKHAITNGVVEGFNCKVKLVKRLGYGFRNFENFRLRILHTCSKSLCREALQ